MSLRKLNILTVLCVLSFAGATLHEITELPLRGIVSAILLGALVGGTLGLLLLVKAQRGEFQLNTAGSGLAGFLKVMLQLALPMGGVLVVLFLTAGPLKEHVFAAVVVWLVTFSVVYFLATIAIEVVLGKRFYITELPKDE